MPVLLLASACEPDLDTTRVTVAQGTFGEIVYSESCQRVAYLSQLDEKAAGLRTVIDVNGSVYGGVCSDNTPAPADAPKKLKALQGQRSVIVSVVDAAMPPDFLAPLEAFLEAIAPLADDGTMETTIKSAGDLLGLLAADTGFGPALARLAPRVGYRAAPVAAGLLPRVIRYAGLDDMLEATLDLLLDATGAPVAELSGLLTALSHELGAAQPVAAPAAADRTLKLAIDLFLTPADGAGDGKARPFVLRDHRGLAQVTLDASGHVPLPFVDKNGDGLADVDLLDRFVDGSGRPLSGKSPFLAPGQSAASGRDAAGRLLDGSGAPVFRYGDLDGTVLHALLAQGPTLLNPQADNTLGLLHGASALLGARAMQTRTYKNAAGATIATYGYNGFSVADSSLLDLAHAYVQLLSLPQSRDTLRIARALLTTYESASSRSVAAMLDASDRGKNHPEAQVPATSDFYDELIPLVVRILRVGHDRTDGNGNPLPSLMEDMMDALSDPHVAGLASMFAAQMTYKDRFVLDQSSQAASGSFGTPVDRTQADSDYNRSIHQRMMHLVHDANGVEFCNKQGASVDIDIPIIGTISLGSFDECKMFQISDLGLFFALTIVDRSITDDPSRPETRDMASFREHITSSTLKGLLADNASIGDPAIQLLAGIQGFTRFPTPQAAARSLFLDTAHQSAFMQGAIDPVTCSDGDRFIDVHNDTIFAWEAPLPGNPSAYPNDSFYDAVRPLLNAFAKHDECVVRASDGSTCITKRNAVKIFLDLISLLHVHWDSPRSQVNGVPYQAVAPNGKHFSTGDNVASYEPLIAEVFTKSDLVPSILALTPTLNTMTIDGTPSTPRARPTIIALASSLFDPRVTPPGVAYRDGATTTVESDGKSPVARATPYYLLADAYAKKRAALAAAPNDRRTAWQGATSSLVDQALTVEQTATGYRTKNRAMHGVTLAAIDFLAARMDAHIAAGDIDAWTNSQLTQDLTDVVSGPIFASLSDLTAKLEGDGPAKKDLLGLLSSLTDTTGGSPAFDATLASAADQLQLFLDDDDLVPIAHTLGAVLDPARNAVTPPLRLMQKARALDPNRPAAGDLTKHTTLVTLLRNFYQEPVPVGPLPISSLSDALAEVNRVNPGAGEPGLAAPDGGSSLDAGLPSSGHKDGGAGDGGTGGSVAGSTGTDLDGADYQHILLQIQSFLTDEDRGYLRFVNIVKSRGTP